MLVSKVTVEEKREIVPTHFLQLLKIKTGVEGSRWVCLVLEVGLRVELGGVGVGFGF
jgi:hypothetical protein